MVQAQESPATSPNVTVGSGTSLPFLSTGKGEVERRRQRQQVTTLSIELERLTSQLAAERVKAEQTSRAKDTRILVMERERASPS